MPKKKNKSAMQERMKLLHEKMKLLRNSKKKVQDDSVKIKLEPTDVPPLSNFDYSGSGTDSEGMAVASNLHMEDADNNMQSFEAFKEIGSFQYDVEKNEESEEYSSFEQNSLNQSDEKCEEVEKELDSFPVPVHLVATLTKFMDDAQRRKDVSSGNAPQAGESVQEKRPDSGLSPTTKTARFDGGVGNDDDYDDGSDGGDNGVDLDESTAEATLGVPLDESPGENRAVDLRNPSLLTCCNCGQSFTKAGYRYHMKHNVCQKSTAEESAQNISKRKSSIRGNSLSPGKAVSGIASTSNSKEELFICEICNKSFKSKPGYVYHSKTHLSERPNFFCSKCGKNFMSSHGFKGHKCKAEEDLATSLACSACRMQFNTLPEYEEHLKLKTCREEKSAGDLETSDSKIKPENQSHFTCDKCNSDFKSALGFKYHMKRNNCSKQAWKKCTFLEVKTGSGKTLHKCNMCEKVFSSKTGCLMHQHLHNRMGFRCTKCGKVYERKYYVSTHRCSGGEQSDGEKAERAREETKWNSFRDCWRCEICKRVMLDKHKLEWHISQQTCGGETKRKPKPISEAKIPCMVCNKKLSTKTSLKYHMQRHSVPALQCVFCGKKYALMRDLRYHEMLHSNPSSAPCTSCGKRFKNDKMLAIHMRIHEPNRISSICAKCGKIFLTPHGFKYHLKRVRCTEEQKKDSSTLALKKNFLPKVVTRGTLTCGHCGKSGLTETTLLRHEQFHSTEKPFACNSCHLCFTSEDPLQTHIREHDRDLNCTYCPAKIRTKLCMQRHLDQHAQGLTMQCKKCHLLFSRPEGLRRHIQKQLWLLVDPLSIRCEYCPARFNSRQGMKSHLKSQHNVGVPFRCRHCGFTAWTRRILNRHVKADHNNGLFHACRYCGKKYVLEFELLKHERETHQVVKQIYDDCKKISDSFEEAPAGRPTAQHTPAAHLADTPNVCARCGEVFSCQFKYSAHFQNCKDSSLDWNCEICKRTFPPTKNKTGHFKWAHEKDVYGRPLDLSLITVQQVKCFECSETFLSREEGVFHMNENAHSELISSDKLCVICWKTFSGKKTFAHHLKTVHDLLFNGQTPQQVMLSHLGLAETTKVAVGDD